MAEEPINPQEAWVSRNMPQGQTDWPTVPAPPNPQVTLLDILAQAAKDPGTDVDKLERLVALYERSQVREAEAAFTAALAEMQPELPEISEKGEILNKQGEVQSKYAKWEDINEVIKPILAKHGFALTFTIGKDGADVAVTAILSHRGGHSRPTTLPLPLDTTGNKNIVQSYGSTVSYGQRYTAIAALNITSRGADDDGQAGGTRLISEGEIEALKALADSGNIDLARFCRFLKVPSLDQIPARRFKYAESTLRDAIRNREVSR